MHHWVRFPSGINYFRKAGLWRAADAALLLLLAHVEDAPLDVRLQGKAEPHARFSDPWLVLTSSHVVPFSAHFVPFCRPSYSNVVLRRLWEGIIRKDGSSALRRPQFRILAVRFCCDAQQPPCSVTKQSAVCLRQFFLGASRHCGSSRPTESSNREASYQVPQAQAEACPE